jgi:hypothetical protein
LEIHRLLEKRVAPCLTGDASDRQFAPLQQADLNQN